ncbi:MAG: SurA N-terminal domain-containing protein [Candidatus Adiutrix sp.]|jgi:peptidyl-prolyl cis-trans isomerase SurA|nr:SurA N-terminal domain-containing protein [Candidatus Adiutrix sp.]
MRFNLMALILTLILAAWPGPARAGLDGVAAVVNGEIITLKQVDNRVSNLAKTRQAAGVPREALRQKVLEGLIDQELINQAAKTKGVFITDSDVSMALESIKKENNLTDAQFQASLAQSGTTIEAFRDDLRVELLRNRVMGAQVIKTVVTDSEVSAFLRGEGPDLGPGPAAGGGGTGDTRPLRMIFLPLDPKNKDKILSEARRIKAEIEGGLSFAAAAKKYSKGPGRDKGGDTGEGATVANLPPEIQAVASKLGSGQPLEPVSAGNAVIIISSVGDPPSAAPAPAPTVKKEKGRSQADDFSPEARESARRQLERYKMQQHYTKWVNDLKRNAVIKINR